MQETYYTCMIIVGVANIVKLTYEIITDIIDRHNK